MGRFVFLMLSVIAAISQAGNVKVLQTSPVGMDYDMEGLLVNVKLKLQMTNVGKEECAVILLMNNEKWNDEGISNEEFVDLSDQLCYADEMLPSKANGQHECELAIPIDRNSLTGAEGTFYIKAYIANIKTKQIVAKGEMVKYTPDTEALREEMIGQSLDFATSLFGNIISGSFNSKDEKKEVPEGCIKCRRCDQTGVCPACDGRRVVDDEKCDACNGTAKCHDCDGRGYIRSFFW